MSLDLYFDQALTMEQGDTLMIPCYDKREQETLRVRLFQLRKKSHQRDLSIYKSELDGKLFISVRKGFSEKGMIIKKSGEIVNLEFVDSKSIIAPTPLPRLAELAIEDGLTIGEFLVVVDGHFTEEDATKEYNLQMEAKNANNT